MRSFSAESWGDLVTLALFTGLFATKTGLIVRNNRRTGQWDGLAKALALVNAVLVALFVLSAAGLVAGGPILPPAGRWALRVVGSASAAVAIWRLLRDEPGDRPTGRRIVS